jgi:hypothetical protein
MQNEMLADPAKVREAIMEDHVADDVLAAALGVGLRSIYQYAAEGMPYIRVGGRRYFKLTDARDWITNNSQTKHKPRVRPPPRPVGRPRKSSK